ncbi:MAG: acyl carrier protein [Lachnospiraceae bacterium]|nr:acyl carrier protein [Lachnospiraceae bacterium]
MEQLIELLQDVRDDIDFESCTDLIDGKVLSSFDIIQIISVLDDEYDISIPATEIVPENFNSAEAIFRMVQKLKR